MAARKRKDTCAISDDVVDILANMRIDGQVVLRYEEQLDRARYQQLNAVLEGLGGKWNRYLAGHVFPEGVVPRERIEAALLTGSYDDPRVGDFFETPPLLADELVDRADLQPGHDVCEPSAGHGAIVRAMRQRELALRRCGSAPSVPCFATHVGENNAERRRKLETMGCTVEYGDFLAVPVALRFDRVVMNPPFSGQQDIDHVLHAHRMLRPDGLLVAVMAAGIRFRQNRKAEGLRAVVQSVGGSIEDLPDGSFLSSGTGVRTVMVTMPSGEL